MRRRARNAKHRGRSSKGRAASARTGTRATSTKHHRETARFRRLSELVAKKLRSLRHERKLTIDAASEAAAVEPMTWYRLEHKRANPTLAVLASLAAVFGMSVSEFLDET
jgi:DNA-binding XRE family transcriptional regulator